MKKTASLLYLLLQVSLFVSAQNAAPAPVNKPMLAAVNVFLKALTEDQRKKAVFPFEDQERFNWYYVPRERNGLPIKDMNASQRKLAMAILQTAMSDQGYAKAKAIMELEVVLKALENRPADDHYRDPEKYFFTVFGKPGATDAPWGWRVDGHHLSLNFTNISGQVIAETPAFMGSNPAIVPEGPQKGKQILKEEAELAFTLLHSLTPEQLKKALIADTSPFDIVTTNKRKVMLQKPEGILYNELKPDQQKVFSQLVNVYLDKYNKDLAQDFRRKVEKAGMNQLYFAWAGSQQAAVGKAHYYRIQNPVLLIEYDNSQNNANHVHSVVRDISNDFGEDALQSHYQKHQHHK